MTGLWQIFGSSRIPMHEMVKIDYLYGANWSIWLDLKILLKTFRTSCAAAASELSRGALAPQLRPGGGHQQRGSRRARCAL